MIQISGITSYLYYTPTAAFSVYLPYGGVLCVRVLSYSTADLPACLCETAADSNIASRDCL